MQSMIHNRAEIIAGITDKNDKAACESAGLIGTESETSDVYLEMIPDFMDLLGAKSSYVRTRAFFLICRQAKWDREGRIKAVFDDMKPLLNDEKPIVVRQCLAALRDVVLYRPEIRDDIGKAVCAIDTGRYRDSMAPLIRKDANALLTFMEETAKGEDKTR